MPGQGCRFISPRQANVQHRGFTLIELLIVVTIIAILAAIAVPNFLEAQTRSKVSRVKADMRTLASMMEIYRVDNNVYPIPSDTQGRLIANPPAATNISPFETRIPVLLTTPVAYITSRPVDPFAVTRAGESQLYNTVTRGYVQLRMQYSPLVNWQAAYDAFFDDLTGRRPPSVIEYFYVSFGPDQDHDVDVPHASPVGVPHTHGKGALYDPTNGTTSSGDIFYFGPGVGFVVP